MNARFHSNATPLVCNANFLLKILNLKPKSRYWSIEILFPNFKVLPPQLQNIQLYTTIYNNIQQLHHWLSTSLVKIGAVALSIQHARLLWGGHIVRACTEYLSADSRIYADTRRYTHNFGTGCAVFQTAGQWDSTQTLLYELMLHCLYGTMDEGKK